MRTELDAVKVSVKQASTVDATNAYEVTVTDGTGDASTVTVHTNSKGKGLWIDGRQAEGTGQFDAGRDPAAAIRRYFSK